MVDYLLFSFSAFIGVVVGEISKDIYHYSKKQFQKRLNGGDKIG